MTPRPKPSAGGDLSVLFREDPERPALHHRDFRQRKVITAPRQTNREAWGKPIRDNFVFIDLTDSRTTLQSEDAFFALRHRDFKRAHAAAGVAKTEAPVESPDAELRTHETLSVDAATLGVVVSLLFGGFVAFDIVGSKQVIDPIVGLVGVIFGITFAAMGWAAKMAR